MLQLKKATRKQVKLRLGMSAVSGGGKTMSALLLAYGMTGDWTKIAVIDTENGSASLYSHIGEFNVIDLTSPFNPERYVESIKACEDGGMEVIILDSITHEWDGKGGILDISNSMTGNSYTNWAKITPRHDAFINSMLQSKCHIISCVRRKQDYEMTKGSDGKLKVEKVGLKEITRDGFEYELTLNFNLEINHQATASKDRTGLFIDQPGFVITSETGKQLIEWCNSGDVNNIEVIEDPKPIKLSQIAIDKLITIEEIEKYLNLVEEGKVAMTQVQVLNLEDKLTQLRNE